MIIMEICKAPTPAAQETAVARNSSANTKRNHSILAEDKAPTVQRTKTKKGID